MAYKEGNPLVKLVILAAVLWGGWKYGLPWLQKQGIVGGSRPAVSGSPSADCVSAADAAVATWSDGITRFMNPPVDPSAWGDFRAEVERKLDQTRGACGCATQACGMATQVSRDLRQMLSDMDAAVRSGGPPAIDLVRTQESIDLKIEEAWKLADAGK